MDGLGVGDPYAFFLQGRVSVRIALRPALTKNANPKRPVPANYVSVFFQEPLLYDVRIFTLPPPFVPCPIPGSVR